MQLIGGRFTLKLFILTGVLIKKEVAWNAQLSNDRQVWESPKQAIFGATIA